MKSKARSELWCGVLAACVAVSVGGVSAQEATSSNAPLVATFDRYSAAASQGNPTSASDLFDESRECLLVRSIDSRMASLRSDTNSILSAPAENSAELSKRLDKVEGAQRRAEASRAMCEGSERKVTTRNIYDIALKAAELGDTAASACFIASPWQVADSDVDRKKGEQYRSAADNLASKMIKKGDWRFVQAMVIASSGGLRSGYARYIQSGDEAAQLRYIKLIRLGASPESSDAKNLDLSIRILTERLSPDEVERADVWAHDMFVRYYASKPQPNDLQACDA